MRELFQNILMWVAVVVGALVSLVACMAYDVLIDDPAVTREARREYVRVSQLEGLEASLAAARDLVAIKDAVARRMRNERNLQATSAEIFGRDLAASREENEQLKEELDELERAAGRDDVPSVGDLGVRVRNR
jgi:hypothetical protein